MKGKAGSPYAIRDYYDIDPDLAEHVDKRMEEFEHLVTRSHECGLKVIMDFVPNHVARQYHSLAKPAGVKDLGEEDDYSQDFNPQNNFYYIPGQKLAGEIDLYDPEQGNYEEMPAKATGNDRFDAWPNRNDWYETIKPELWGRLPASHRRTFRPDSGHLEKNGGHTELLGRERYRRFPL